MKTERKNEGKKHTTFCVSPEQCFNIIILTISAMLRELLEQSENEMQNVTKKKKKEKNSVVCCTMRTTRLKVTFLTVNQLTVE